MAVITKQDLIDAAIDAQAFEDVVNTNNPSILTRLGLSVKSLYQAMQELGSFTDKGVWTTSTAYAVKDLVSESSVIYVCIVAHTSNVFATDKTSGYWSVYQTDTLTADEIAGIQAAATGLTGANPVVTVADKDLTADELGAIQSAATAPTAANPFVTVADKDLTADELAAIGGSTPAATGLNPFVTEAYANLPSSDEKGAMGAASSPSATNPFATIANLPSSSFVSDYASVENAGADQIAADTVANTQVTFDTNGPSAVSASNQANNRLDVNGTRNYLLSASVSLSVPTTDKSMSLRITKNDSSTILGEISFDLIATQILPVSLTVCVALTATDNVQLWLNSSDPSVPEDITIKKAKLNMRGL